MICPSRRVANRDMETCLQCQNRWRLIPRHCICICCKWVDRNKDVYKFSAANNMQISQTEEILIARVHVFIEVCRVRSQQYKYSGTSSTSWEMLARFTIHWQWQWIVNLSNIPQEADNCNVVREFILLAANPSDFEETHARLRSTSLRFGKALEGLASRRDAYFVGLYILIPNSGHSQASYRRKIDGWRG